MKEKTYKPQAERPRSQNLRAEIDATVALKQKAEADLANSQEARKGLRERKRKLQVAAYQNDAKAVQRREEANKKLIELELQESDLADTVAELASRIQRLEIELNQAERSEAASRMIERQPLVMERMKRVWSAYEVFESEIKSLWQTSREDWADAAVVGIQNMNSRKWTHTWHLADIIERLAKMADKSQPLPHGDFLKPLPELVEESQKAAKGEINRALKQGQTQSEEKEVA